MLVGMLPGKDHSKWVVFVADLVVLKPKGIDVILVMDWLTQHNGTIACSARTVTLTNHEGTQVNCHTLGCKPDPIVYSLEAKTLEEVPVVDEYPDVFPEELPGMPPDRALSSSLISFLEQLPKLRDPTVWQPEN